MFVIGSPYGAYPTGLLHGGILAEINLWFAHGDLAWNPLGVIAFGFSVRIDGFVPIGIAERIRMNLQPRRGKDCQCIETLLTAMGCAYGYIRRVCRRWRHSGLLLGKSMIKAF